jgi:hypothetical protein
MEILSGASFPNTFTFYSKLMRILTGASFHPNTYSLFNSYSKLMKMLTGASHLPKFISLIQFLKQSALLLQFSFKINANPLWSFLPSQYIFLIQLLFKTDGNPLWRPPPTPVHCPYSILIQKHIHTPTVNAAKGSSRTCNH